MLHRIPVLWKFYKVQHSVKEMGFAAQFRFHFMEAIVYKSLQYIPLAMIGFGIEQFFIIHKFSIFVGHLNHANLDWNYRKLGFIFNNPRMHLWHPVKELPRQHKYGMNFGLTVSLWDYIFGAAYVPKSGKDLTIGYKGDETFPKDFKGLWFFLLKTNN